MKEKKMRRGILSGTVESFVKAEAAKERLRSAASSQVDEVIKKFNSDQLHGLSFQQARKNEEIFGKNSVNSKKKDGILKRLTNSFINPFTLILAVLAIISSLTDIVFASANEKNYVTVSIISFLVLLSGVLRFIQETRSGNAAAKLSELISTTTLVQREGTKQEISVSDVVVGDIVYFSAGDMIPADIRIITAKDLFLSQSSLTGESAPVEKNADSVQNGTVTEAECLAFMGTSVVSGSGCGIVIATGSDTILGQTAKTLTSSKVKTAFDKEIDSVSKLLIIFMLVMVPVVFLINGFTKHDWAGAALFAVSIAVGLTPEMLPMIVTTCLAKGAMTLSGKKVIVKDLNCIQNLGAIDVFCTDKTGTITQDKVVLELHLNINGEEDPRVLRHAFLNSNYQTGLKNLMDEAVIVRTEELCQKGEIDKDVLSKYQKVDEIPFDFERRRMSVAVCDNSGKTQLITKGAVEEMLKVSKFAEINGSVCDLTEEKKKLVLQKANDLNEKGLRVIAVAQKTMPLPEHGFSVNDESDMVLIGYLAFLDPPKESTAKAISRLQKSGVKVKILTGDSEKVTACVCGKVGLNCKDILLGIELEEMSDARLAEVAENVTVFAKLTPSQKERVVRVLREKGHVVGFMGDGINDAAAMRAADVGISVDTAADIAKEAAGIILLEKDLTVVADGIVEGRKTCVNMVKYIKITASSNFGNMLSVLFASAFLPFVPMLAVQLVLLNLIYDLSCTALPWDRVDKKYLDAPSSWNAGSVAKFMITFGPVSSIFDIVTYIFMFFVFCPQVVGGSYATLNLADQDVFISLFQTGWFIESAFTQTFVIHMLRTDSLWVLKNRSSASLMAFTFSGVAVSVIIPYVFAGRVAGFIALPVSFFGFLAVVLVLYMLLSTFVKYFYIKKSKRLL